MPYKTNKDLPDNVRHVLPAGAQTIFREAFNNAIKQYADRAVPEEVAFKVAWSAVKRKYEKKNGKWREK